MKNYLKTFYNYNLLETVGQQTGTVTSDVLKDDATIKDLEFLDMQKFAEYLLRMKPKMVEDGKFQCYFSKYHRSMIPYSFDQDKEKNHQEIIEKIRQENIEKWNWLIKQHYEPFFYNQFGPIVNIFYIMIAEATRDTGEYDPVDGYRIIEKIKGKYNIWINFYSDDGSHNTSIFVKYSEIPLDIRQEVCDKILKELNL